MSGVRVDTMAVNRAEAALNGAALGVVAVSLGMLVVWLVLL
jgi:hypothetical protein